MPTPPRDRRGAGGDWEARARAHLEGHGLRAVAANVGYRFGELDLVMRAGEALVFVEVRYRKSEHFGGAAASVDTRKCRRIVLAAQGFLAAHPAHAARTCRFDVVAIDGSSDSPRIDWLRDAFRLEDC